MRTLNDNEILCVSGGELSGMMILGVFSGIQGYNWGNTITIAAIMNGSWGLFAGAAGGLSFLEKFSNAGIGSLIGGGICGGLLGIPTFAAIGAVEALAGYYIGNLLAPYLKAPE